MSGEEEEKAPVPAPSKATAAEADEELKLYRGLEVGGSVGASGSLRVGVVNQWHTA